MPIYKKRYRLDDRISETPGSQVYKGQDLETRQWVVVKKISFNPYVFESEISFLKKLNHPNIVRLLDYFEEEDSYYIVTEWFDGIPVTQHSLSEEEWTDIFISIVKGIQYIHENGVIHRDLKPQNILVSDNKQVKIIDFGISVFQKDIKEEGGKILGTLPYMSPEQTGYLKSGTDIRSDLYSLGVIFYECLSGENPFLGQDKSEIIHKHLSLTPTPLHKKAGEKKSRTYRLLGKIISNLLEKDPVNRYQSSEELVTDLERILQVKFPLHGGAPKVVLREKLVREAEEKFHKLAKNPKGLLLIQGKYGAGKTFLFKNVLDSICESAKVLEFKVIRSTPFSFGEKLLAETGESPEETQRILEMRLPVLAIENIQRMDEPSWNLLMQRKNLLIIGTRDEDESFENLKNTSIPREEINLAPYTLEEVSEFINRVFSNNISIPQSILQKIYHFSKGNLEILIYLLKLFYREKILVYREKKWVFEKAEQIFSSVEETSILNYRFSKLDQDFLEFMKSVAIYGFSFNLENLKKFHTFLRKKPMEIKRCLKMAEEQSILEKTGNDYVFLNKNIHQYFLRLTPEEERIEKHLRIAKTIERLKTIKNRFFPLFYHYSRTYEYQKAYVWGNRLILELVNKYSYQQATEVFEKVIGFFEKIPEKSEGDYIQFYELLQNMINIYIFKGDYEEIIQILKQQSEFLAKKREKERISNVYLNLGKLFTLKGQLKEARDWFQKAEEISHALNQPKLLKSIYENTSMNYLFSSRFREAIRYFEKAQQFYQKEDYQQSRMITFLGIIAFAYGNIGLYEKAEEVLKRLESLIENEENPHLKYIGLHYRVLVLSHIGDVNALNEDKLRDALERVEKEGNKLVEYSLYFSIGYYYYKKKKLIKAFDYVSRSVSIGGDVQVEVGILAPYLVLAEIGIKLKKYQEVQGIFKKIKKQIRENRDFFSYQWYLRLKALLMSYSVKARPQEIEAIIQKAIRISRKLKVKPEIARNYYYYSMVCFNTGEFKKGFALEQKSLTLFNQMGMQWEEFEMKNMLVNQSIQSTQQFFGERVKIEALSKISHLIAKQKNTSELLKEIMKLAIEIGGCNRGGLFLFRDQKPELVYNWELEPDFTISSEILDFLNYKKEPYIGTGNSTKSFIYLPIKVQNQVSGVVYLENDLIQNIFDTEQIQIMNILSTVFGVLMENSKAYRALEEEKKNLEEKVEERTKEVYLRNQIIEKDLSATRKFHTNLMPKNVPDLPGFHGTFYYQPAEEIGGDFYDFIQIDKDRFLFVIADSAGHGIRASLLTAMLKTSLLTYPDKSYSSPRELISHINESLYGQVMDKYIVCLIGKVDMKKNEVSLIGGGNITVFNYEREQDSWEKIPIKGHMLGIIPTNMLQFTEKRIRMNPGDRLFLSTDGIVEQYIRDMNRGRKIFGEERIKEILEENRDPGELLQQMVRSVKKFSGKERFSDDITAMIFWRSL